MKIRLTDRFIKAIPVPKKGVARIGDADTKGFGVVKRTTGSVSYYFEYTETDGARRRIFFGEWPTLALAQARDQAAAMRNQVRAGESLRPEAADESVASLLPQWLALVDTTQPESAIRYRRVADRYIAMEFGKLAPRDVKRNAIELWHGRLAKRIPSHANFCLLVLSAFMSWCRRDDLVEFNPCTGIARAATSSRATFLDAQEIRVVETYLERRKEDRSASLSMAVALMTGARIGEVIGIRAHTVNLRTLTWSKPATHVKGKRDHIVPLPQRSVPLLAELLKLDPPTNRDLRRVIAGVRALIGRPEIRVHDMRHSAASSYARRGASLQQIGRLLGHASVVTTQKYSHLVADDLRNLIERPATPVRKRA